MLSLNKGEICAGRSADFLMYEVKKGDPFDHLLRLSAAKVKWLWRNGRPIFGDIGLGVAGTASRRKFSKFEIEGQEKFATGDFPNLIRTIKHYAPDLDLPRILPQ
jgi:hypothetical protein